MWTVRPEPADSPDAVAPLRAAEARACELGLTRLFLDTRHDLVEAPALDAAHGFVEVVPFSPPGRFKDHRFEKHHIGSAR